MCKHSVALQCCLTCKRMSTCAYREATHAKVARLSLLLGQSYVLVCKEQLARAAASMQLVHHRVSRLVVLAAVGSPSRLLISSKHDLRFKQEQAVAVVLGF